MEACMTVQGGYLYCGPPEVKPQQALPPREQSARMIAKTAFSFVEAVFVCLCVDTGIGRPEARRSP